MKHITGCLEEHSRRHTNWSFTGSQRDELQKSPSHTSRRRMSDAATNMALPHSEVLSRKLQCFSECVWGCAALRDPMKIRQSALTNRCRQEQMCVCVHVSGWNIKEKNPPDIHFIHYHSNWLSLLRVSVLTGWERIIEGPHSKNYQSQWVSSCRWFPFPISENMCIERSADGGFLLHIFLQCGSEINSRWKKPIGLTFTLPVSCTLLSDGHMNRILTGIFQMPFLMKHLLNLGEALLIFTLQKTQCRHACVHVNTCTCFSFICSHPFQTVTETEP